MTKQERKQIINTIEICLNEATLDDVKYIVSHLSDDREDLRINYVIYDDFNILHVIEILVQDQFTNLRCGIQKFHTVEGALFITANQLSKIEKAIEKAENILNGKDGE